VTLEEFIEYYSNISATVGTLYIDDDRYFELMIKNAWNFEGKTTEKAWATDMTAPARRARN
jgi:hypothetical protein